MTAPSRPFVSALPHAARAEAGDLVGSYDCYIYMGSMITYTQMGFTLDADGTYEWGFEQDGRYRGEGGTYEVRGPSIAFTGAMEGIVGGIKPKDGGRAGINLIPDGNRAQTMYGSPR